PLETAYERLRRIGDIAAKHGVKIGMETHPDLCENGAKAAATMTAIGHPSIGVNYDTANVYYYNHGVDTVGEAAKAAPHTVSVHLKDTLGGYEDASFPRFGEGVVDFGKVFEVFNAEGFTGPFTIELEGKLTQGETDDENQAHVQACVDHLRGLGLVP
ncbi:sugar phosphate isomerase/epimerase, partial [bacterium]|nr:sugar phosphate isomerase/epimerase [bacterium]